MEVHNHNNNFNLKDIILGGQDGLVNVLGVILGVAAATYEIKIIIVAGLAATFAESISMAAVAYTSTKASLSYYLAEEEREKREIKEDPRLEKKEIYDIYYKKGFRGKLLNDIVKKIISNKKLWLETMMTEELKLYNDNNPKRSSFIVGLSAFIGSLIPLLPFFFFDVKLGVIISLIFSSLALFITGFVKAKVTVGSEIKSGLEILFIGMLSALAGYLIGYFVGKI